MKKLYLVIVAAFAVLLNTSCVTEAHYRGQMNLASGHGYQGHNYRSRCGGCGSIHVQGTVCRAYPCGRPDCAPSRSTVIRGPIMNGQCGCRGQAVYSGSSWSYRSISSCSRSGCGYHTGAPAYIQRNPPRIPSGYGGQSYSSSVYQRAATTRRGGPGWHEVGSGYGRYPGGQSPYQVNARRRSGEPGWHEVGSDYGHYGQPYGLFR